MMAPISSLNPSGCSGGRIKQMEFLGTWYKEKSCSCGNTVSCFCAHKFAGFNPFSLLFILYTFWYSIHTLYDLVGVMPFVGIPFTISTIRPHRHYTLLFQNFVVVVTYLVGTETGLISKCSDWTISHHSSTFLLVGTAPTGHKCFQIW